MSSATYSYNVLTDFPDGRVNIRKLQNEILSSAITITIDNVTRTNDALDIVFKAPLPAQDKTILDGDVSNPAGGLIAAHDNTVSARPQPQTVAVREDEGETGGNFYRMSVAIDADANTTTVHDQQLLVDSLVNAVYYETSAENRGDSIEVHVAPDTTVGAITADVSIGEQTISVQQSVIDVVIRGPMTVTLTEGPQSAFLGQILSVDSSNGTITTEFASTAAFLASTPATVQVTRIFIDESVIASIGTHEAGKSKVGGSAIPANQTVRLRYLNRSPPEPVGQITSDVANGSNTIDVDDSVLSLLVFGDKVDLHDGTLTSSLGTVSLVDKFAKQITVTGTSSNDFLAATPTFVRKTAKKFVAHIEMLQ